jgi:hypothetical protein
MWSNRWSTMPVQPAPELRLPRPDGRAVLRSMPGTGVPVITQPFEPGDRLPFWAGFEPPSDSYLFDTESDPGEHENRIGERGEDRLVEALATELRTIGAPSDLLQRVGIA